MLEDNEFQPHFSAFAQACRERNLNDLTDQEFAQHCQAFNAFLVPLRQRLAWEIPLIQGYSAAGDATDEVIETSETLTNLLSSGSDAEGLLEVLNQLEKAVLHVGFLQSQLPTIVDVKIVNELLILGSQHANGDEYFDPDGVAQRLPILLGWLDEQDKDWEVFHTLYPHREALVERAHWALQAIRGGAGAVHLFLEGEDPEGLQSGLKLIVEALKGLSAVEETRYLEETETVQFSNDVRLERMALLVAAENRYPKEYDHNIRAVLRDLGRVLLELSGWLESAGADPESLAATDKLGQTLQQLGKQLEQLPAEAPAEQAREFLRAVEKFRVDLFELRKRFAPEEAVFDFSMAEEVVVGD